MTNLSGKTVLLTGALGSLGRAQAEAYAAAGARLLLLALLWQFKLAGADEEFLTVRASPWWRPCEEVEDGLPDGRHTRLWRRAPDSFFSVPLP